MSGEEAAVFKDNELKSKLNYFEVFSVKKVPRARTIGAPVETGAISFDNKVVDPFELIVTGKVLTMNSYITEQLEEMLANRNFTFYSVTDGVRSYHDLILEQCPFERNVDKFDWLEVQLRFKQAMFIQTKTDSPANAENSDMRNGGNINGTEG